MFSLCNSHSAWSSELPARNAQRKVSKFYVELGDILYSQVKVFMLSQQNREFTACLPYTPVSTIRDRHTRRTLSNTLF